MHYSRDAEESFQYVALTPENTKAFAVCSQEFEFNLFQFMNRIAAKILIEDAYIFVSLVRSQINSLRTLNNMPGDGCLIE